MKARITVTVDKELLDWLDANVSRRRFANRSHALEFLTKTHKEQHEPARGRKEARR